MTFPINVHEGIDVLKSTVVGNPVDAKADETILAKFYLP